MRSADMRGLPSAVWKRRLELLERVIRFVDDVPAPVPAEATWLLKALHLTRRRAQYAVALAERHEAKEQRRR